MQAAEIDRKKSMAAAAAVIAVISFALLIPAGCKKKPEKNKVDIDQLDYDDSNDYRYIFRDEIEKENWKKNRYKKEKF